MNAAHCISGQNKWLEAGILGKYAEGHRVITMKWLKHYLNLIFITIKTIINAMRIYSIAVDIL